MMRRPPNTPGSIRLPAVPTNLSGNAWNITHDPPMMSSFGINRSVDAVTYNGYNMMPPYLGAVNNTNIPLTQQLPIITIGGPTYNYSNQIMYSAFIHIKSNCLSSS